LTASNTYTGDTIISGGTLEVAGNNGWNGRGGTYTIYNGGDLQVDNAANQWNVGASTTVNINGGGKLAWKSTGGDANSPYLNTVNLDSSNGLAATFDATVGNSAPRFGYYANGLIMSTGTAANAWNGGIILANGSSYSLTLAVTAPLSISGAIRDLSGYAGTPVYKTGTGNLILSGSSTYSGGTIIGGGTLAYGANNALPTTGPVTVSGGNLNLLTYSGSVGAVTLTSGTIAGGSGVLTGSSYAAQSGIITARLGGGNGVALIKSTTGLVTLSGSNTYGGGTTISAGTLAVLPGGSIGSGNVTIAPGGVLDVSQFGGPYSLTQGTLTAGRTASFATDINGSLNVQNASVNVAGTGVAGTMKVSGSMLLSSGTLSFDQGDQIVLAGGLALVGTDYIVPNSTLATGTYNLFSYSGLSGGTANLALGGPFATNPRYSYSFNASGGTSLALVVSGSAGNLYWRGGTWDNQTSLSWYNASKVPPGMDFFYGGDNVTFDDSAGTTNGVVAIGGTAGGVLPASVTVNNSSVNYTFSGTGSIGGGTSLVKLGSGALTMTSSNSYWGGTSLSVGTLNANVAYALGTGSVAINGGVFNLGFAQSPSSVALSGGLLNLAASAGIGTGPLTITGGSFDNTNGASMTLAANNPQTWGGSFAFLGSNPLNTGTGAITMNAGSAVAVKSSTLTVAGVISGVGSLAKNGSGTLVLSASNAYGGGTTVSAGTLVLGYNVGYNLGNAPSAGSGAISINPGAYLTGSNFFTVGGGYNNTRTINVNGGILDTKYSGTGGEYFANWNMTGGTIADSASSGDYVRVPYSGLSITTNASNTGAVISSNLDMTFANITANVSQGTVNTGRDLIISGNITQNTGAGSGAKSFTKSGNGLLAISGASTYTGMTTISGGALAIGSGGTTGSLPTSSAIVDNATLAFNRSDNINQTTVSSSSGISGSGGLLQMGPGNLTANVANSYSGGTTISAGTLTVANASALGGKNAGPLNANGGVLDLAGYNIEASALSGAAGVITSTSSGSVATLTVSQSTSTSFTGAINDGLGHVALDLQGSGTLMLCGTDSYTGGTTVEGGTLILTNKMAIADGTSLMVGDPEMFQAPTIPSSEISPAAAAPLASTAVPESGTVALLTAGTMLVLASRKRFAIRKMSPKRPAPSKKR
jgi:autotransporter-associated beta strand protein